MPGRPLVAWILVALGAWLSSRPGTAQGIALTLQDDRGVPIRGDVKVCVYRGLDTQCWDAPPYFIPASLEDFDSLTAEGPDHGPVHPTRQSLRAAESGGYLLVVPRKATIAFTRLGRRSLSASLYDRGDKAFRKPVVRFEAVQGGERRIPARSYVLSLSDGSRAPDLQFLTAEPGVRYQVAFHEVEGWSAIIRCSAGRASRPVAKAVVVMLSSANSGLERELSRAVTTTDGVESGD
jgi:hypothetical protein